MKFFCLSAVFEYGLVSFLIQLETSRERQFEAVTVSVLTLRSLEKRFKEVLSAFELEGSMIWIALIGW